MGKLTLFGFNRESFSQLIRYGLVGITSNLVGYSVYLLIVYLGATPKLTMTFLYGISASIGYLGNRNLTFKHKGSLVGSGVRYAISQGCGYFINLLMLVVFVDQLGYAHQWVQAAAIFVVAGFLFVAFKFFVFKDMNVSDAGTS